MDSWARVCIGMKIGCHVVVCPKGGAKRQHGNNLNMIEPLIGEQDLLYSKAIKIGKMDEFLNKCFYVYADDVLGQTYKR